MIEFLGIDIGGTNIRVGAIDEKERLVGFYNNDKDHQDRPYIRTYFN